MAGECFVTGLEGFGAERKQLGRANVHVWAPFSTYSPVTHMVKDLGFGDKVEETLLGFAVSLAGQSGHSHQSVGLVCCQCGLHSIH